MRVLFVEDVPGGAEITRSLDLGAQILDHPGWSADVDVYRDGRLALDKLQDPSIGVDPYDLVLVDFDLGLPFDGRAILRLAEQKRWSAHRVLFTARDSLPAELVDPRTRGSEVQEVWVKAGVLGAVADWWAKRKPTCQFTGAGCLGPHWRTHGRLRGGIGGFVYLSFAYTPGGQQPIAEAVGQYEGFVGSAVEHLGLRCLSSRTDAVQHVTPHIIGAIAASQVVLIDLAELRPNVCLEAGIALALQKDLLLLKPDSLAPSDVPHALKDYNYVTYKGGRPWRDDLCLYRLTTRLGEMLTRR